jgi:peptidoglycan/LPS O-acetylase OafA/YrhL
MEQIERLVRSQIVPFAAGIVLISIALTVGPNDGFLFLVGYPLVAICSAAVIIHTVTATWSMATRALSSRPLVWTGARSYGMYLYFLPLMSLVSAQRLGVSFWPAFILRIGVVFAAAALSYRFIESRFLRKNRYPGAPSHVQRAKQDLRLDSGSNQADGIERPPRLRLTHSEEGRGT